MQDDYRNKGRSRKKDAPGRSRKKHQSSAARKLFLGLTAAFVFCALIFAALRYYGGADAFRRLAGGDMTLKEFLAEAGILDGSGTEGSEASSVNESEASSEPGGSDGSSVTETTSPTEPETTSLGAEELQRLREEEESRLAEEERLRKEAELNALLEQGYHLVSQADPDRITLRFAGDILFDPSYAIMASLLQRSGGFPDISRGFDEGMMSCMRGADIFMINNEFPYSSRGTPLPGKQFTFRAKPEYASLMKDIGADLVGLANNHVNDYGPDSMQDTFSTLEGIGLPFCGAGRNIDDASRPVLFTNGEVKIAILAATQIERMGNPDTVGATESSAGVFRCLYDMDRLTARIRECKKMGCFTIVFIHWGTEGTEHIDDWQLKQGKQIAQAGADAIVGAHPHILQRLDWVDGIRIHSDGSESAAKVPVIYSLGNYLFNSKTLDTGLYELVLNAHDGSVEQIRFIPAVQSGCRTRYADPSEAEGRRILQHMREISPNVSILEDGRVELK